MLWNHSFDAGLAGEASCHVGDTGRGRPLTIAWCHSAVTGGAKRATHDLVRQLTRRGHTIDEFIVSPNPMCDYLPLKPYTRATYETRLDIPRERDLRPYFLQTYLHFAQTRWCTYRNAQRLREVARVINAGDYDFIHVDHHPLSYAVGVLPLMKRPTVVYSHEVFDRRYVNHRHATSNVLRRRYTEFCRLPGILRTTLRHRYENRCLSYAKLVLTNSHYSAETWFALHGVPARVCKLGVDTEQFRSLGLVAEPIVLSVGRLVAPKRHDVVIEAVASMEQSTRPAVVIATPEVIPGALTQASLVQLAGDRDVELRLICGPSQAQLITLYNQALAVVFVPSMEPFGLVALEAMACGTPVIGVREGGVRESILDGETGFLVDRDPVRIAAAIKRLQTDEQLRKTIKERAVNYVQMQWTWAKAVERYEYEVERFLSATVS